MIWVNETTVEEANEALNHALLEEAEMWDNISSCQPIGWEGGIVAEVQKAFPQLSPGQAMAIYRLGYLRGYEKAQSTLEHAKRLFI